MTEQQCGRCRTTNPSGAAFCHGCGAALASADAAARAEAAPSGWALATAGMAQAPEQVAGHGPLRRDELAGWWQRLGASLLDGIFVMLLLAVAAGLLTLLAWLVDREAVERTFDWFADELSDDAYGASNAWWWLAVAGPLLVLGYLLWEVLWIRSAKHMARPGQWIAGFRVVRAEGIERLSTARAVGRMAAKWLYNVPRAGTLVTIASAFTIGLTKRRQGIHDMISGTVCIRRDALARRGIGPDANDEALVRQAEWRMQASAPSAPPAAVGAAPGAHVPPPPPPPPPGTPPPGSTTPSAHAPTRRDGEPDQGSPFV